MVQTARSLQFGLPPCHRHRGECEPRPAHQQSSARRPTTLASERSCPRLIDLSGGKHRTRGLCPAARASRDVPRAVPAGQRRPRGDGPLSFHPRGAAARQRVRALGGRLGAARPPVRARRDPTNHSLYFIATFGPAAELPAGRQHPHQPRGRRPRLPHRRVPPGRRSRPRPHLLPALRRDPRVPHPQPAGRADPHREHRLRRPRAGQPPRRNARSTSATRPSSRSSPPTPRCRCRTCSTPSGPARPPAATTSPASATTASSTAGSPRRSSTRTSSGGRVALLFMDLDNFKRVNDTHGHLAGSQVLKEVGYLLRRVVRVPGVTLARYGGDEFVIIIPGFDLASACRVAEEMRQTIRRRERSCAGRFSWADGPVDFQRPADLLHRRGGLPGPRPPGGHLGPPPQPAPARRRPGHVRGQGGGQGPGAGCRARAI